MECCQSGLEWSEREHRWEGYWEEGGGGGGGRGRDGKSKIFTGSVQCRT